MRPSKQHERPDGLIEGHAYTIIQAVELPDVPGTPNAPVRNALRDRYGVEAALGGFAGVGNFVRLSYAAYSSQADVEKLRDAVLEIAGEQRRGR